MREKLDFYDRYGVEEYYYYDPEGARLQGWLRAEGGGLEPIPPAGLNGWRGPRLDVTVENSQIKEGPGLRGTDGEPFKTFGQLAQDRKAAIRIAELESRRARRERRKAQAERRRAEQAERDRERAERDRDEALARAERLAARLRELGLEEP